MTETLIDKYGLQKHISEPDKGGQLTIEELVTFLDESLPVERAAVERLFPLVFPVIDPCFLKMRHSSPILKRIGADSRGCGSYLYNVVAPRFALYSQDSSRCIVNLSVEISRFDQKVFAHTVDPTNLPDVITIPFSHAFFYDKVIKGDIIYETVDQFRAVSQFKGFIPPRVRNTLKKAKPIFDEQVYIIGEADWKAEQIEHEDPLIVGVSGETCYLVDAFNCTPMEDYVRREFRG